MTFAFYMVCLCYGLFLLTHFGDMWVQMDRTVWHFADQLEIFSKQGYFYFILRGIQHLTFHYYYSSVVDCIYYTYQKVVKLTQFNFSLLPILFLY